MLTAGSLFSGIGGLDLGLERAGIKIAWQCESDEFCRRVLKKHWPDVPCYEDIKAIDHDTPKVDTLFGGFPCQPISDHGRRDGTTGDRWLWPEFARVIKALKPQYVLIENIPALLRRGMREVLTDLSSLRYDAEWDVLPAAFFGAPHQRERIFILAYSHSKRRGGGWGIDAEHALPYYEDWNTAQGISEWEGWKRWLVSLLRDSNWEETPSAIRGMDDGAAKRLHRARIKACGNAVTPQQAEFMGSMIVRMENHAGA